MQNTVTVQFIVWSACKVGSWEGCKALSINTCVEFMLKTKAFRLHHLHQGTHTGLEYMPQFEQISLGRKKHISKETFNINTCKINNVCHRSLLDCHPHMNSITWSWTVALFCIFCWAILNLRRTLLVLLIPHFKLVQHFPYFFLQRYSKQSEETPHFHLRTSMEASQPQIHSFLLESPWSPMLLHNSFPA